MTGPSWELLRSGPDHASQQDGSGGPRRLVCSSIRRCTLVEHRDPTADTRCHPPGSSLGIVPRSRARTGRDNR
jgi:hypothetical protein